jgi:acyl-coenzyme A thioesterase PaaI-like protein
MSKQSPALKAWKQLSGYPGGKWLFSKLLCLKAPYFGSIRPVFEVLEPGRCEVRVAKRRRVTNHLGTVHAIAMCNAAELAGGTMTEVSMPPTHRWIPKGMTVEYLRKAETDLRAVAALDPIPDFGEATELPVTVNVTDTRGETVFRAVITMWISPKKG